MTSRFFQLANACTVISLLSVSSLVAQDSWPQFRGPDGMGHAPLTGLPLTWSESENVTWKMPIVGKEWSSPVVAEGKIWMTTAVDYPANEQQHKQRLETSTNDQPLA